MKIKARNLRFGLVLLVALLIRLISLNQSLWLDEGVTAKVVREYSLTDIPRLFSPHDFHPPLYYLLMKLWTNIFGYSEVALRMPSVLFSIGIGVLLYAGFGLFAASVFLFNPLIVYYSQEARMYMMAVFLLTAGWYCIEKKIKKTDKLWLPALFAGILFSFAFSSYYGSLFFIAAILLNLFIQKKYKELLVIGLPLLVTLFVLSTLLSQQITYSRAALGEVVNWGSVLGPTNVKNLLLFPVKFSIGRISFYPKALYWGLSAVWSLFFVLIAINGLRRKIGYAVLLGIPLILGVIVSFFSPMLQYFRFLFLLPVIAVLIARGSEKNITVRFILVVGSLWWVGLYLLIPGFHREDWKGLSGALPLGQVYMIKSASDPLRYYRSDVQVRELRTIDKKILNNSKELYVIPYVADIYGFDYVSELNALNYAKLSTQTYRGVVLEKWRRKL